MMKATFRIHNTEPTSTPLISRIGDYSFRVVLGMSKRRFILIPVLLLTSSAAIGVLWVNHDFPTITRPSTVETSSSTTSTPRQTTHTRTTTTATTRATTSATTTSTASSSTSLWHPALVTSWQWQLSSTPIDLSIHVQVYDIDAFDNDASQVAAIHATGAKAVCYISGGTLENWRPDANSFPSSVTGNAVSGWAGEKWLDIRQISILGPIMEARMDICVTKGFDGIEADNVDGYTNPTGFPLKYQDQLNYNIFLANAAHARGLSIGLKNDVDQVKDLVSYFDWALNEECFKFNECDTLLPFINAGKPVFQTEYDTSQYCAEADGMNFNSIVKHLSLDAWRQPCRGT